MKTIFILMIVVGGWKSGNSVFFQEFTSQEKCVLALERFNNTKKNMGNYISSAKAVCLEK